MLDKQTMVTAHNALPGRTTAMSIDDTHFVNGSSLTAAPQSGQQQILIGMGCFWGAERLFGNWTGDLHLRWLLRRFYAQSDL